MKIREGSKKDGVVYQIRNIITNKKYIGSTVNFKKRVNRHLNELKKGNHGNINLQKDYNIYGKDNYIFEILSEHENGEHIYEEDRILKNTDFKELFNINMGANGGDMLKHHPNKAEIISKIVNEKSINRLINYTKNMDITGENNPNWKGGISSIRYNCNDCGNELGIGNLSGLCNKCNKKGKHNPFYGKKLSEEHKEKLSKSLIGKTPPNIRKISISGKIYENMTIAAKELKVNVSVITWRCKSKNFPEYEYLS